MVNRHVCGVRRCMQHIRYGNVIADAMWCIMRHAAFIHRPQVALVVHIIAPTTVATNIVVAVHLRYFWLSVRCAFAVALLWLWLR